MFLIIFLEELSAFGSFEELGKCQQIVVSLLSVSPLNTTTKALVYRNAIIYVSKGSLEHEPKYDHLSPVRVM